ncbi:hypothetical protein LO762_07555 [Actinocorallia sp. API 0066]|uniref:hypothetical protein n=1 Tax=Actinocorallia sp. API 0066 TaxID=2896846 RepID=UPI001E2D9F2F|nr:hypothetical protein [Actinocorallia sp. API 0066]MCD0449045.1 hypothetical protein [Actinocorallia sp. API 0066]
MESTANVAIKHTSFSWITANEYTEFANAVGQDITTTPNFTLFRDIRELRMTCFLAQHAAEHPHTHAPHEARLRLHCLRGNHGPRPWPWNPA